MIDRTRPPHHPHPTYLVPPPDDTIIRMSVATQSDSLAGKIARLVEERGWNQEDFARITKLNRQTVRQILLNQGRKPHNATVQACAKALGLSVGELRTLPVDRLLPRMHGQRPAEGDDTLRRLYDRATQPELLAWLERNVDRARQLTPAEIDEILELQENGSLGTIGIERCVELIERRRRLLEQVRAITRTEYLAFLEQLVGLLHDRVQPPAGRG
ncbi:MAG TPA: helix-turn-helix transcriptional regulator [Gemmataceae bacterium]|nr:helix-turn-helix transcriptional regulator [Gemmataceae bacterium]